jgi:hypothetical protein
MTALPRFDSFVLLADMRTGSNLLQERLNAVPGLCCLGEVFNPEFVGTRGADALLGMTLAERDENPLGMLGRLRIATPGLNGFRLFPDHDARVLAACLADRRCAKVILTRNPIDSFVSLQIASATDQWRLGSPSHRRQAQVGLDPVALEAFLERRQAFHGQVLRALQRSGQTAFALDYDDLADPEVLAGLVCHLTGAPPLVRTEPPGGAMLRQNPGRAVDKLCDPAEALQVLAAVDWFDLARLPLAEPRPGLHTAKPVLSRRLPLVWLPLPGGAPKADLRAWMARLHPRTRPARHPGEDPEAALIERPAPADLEEWLHATAQQRTCIAVIEHPARRIWRAFDRDFRPGAAGRRFLAMLQADYGMRLPPGDGTAQAPSSTDAPVLGDLRAALAAFLRFLADALNGQHPDLALPAGWHSQSACLDAYAGLLRPDRLLRAERLRADLEALAADRGWQYRPATPVGDADGGPEGRLDHGKDGGGNDRPLPAGLWTPEIERLAQAALGVDYRSLGFAALAAAVGAPANEA